MRISRRSRENLAQASLTEANDAMSIFTNVVPAEVLAETSATRDLAASAFRPLK